jgi:hypothetical protein
VGRAHALSESLADEPLLFLGTPEQLSHWIIEIQTHLMVLTVIA